MALTREEAARILDPETSREALLPYALDRAYRLEIVNEACRIGAEALRGPAREQVERMRGEWEWLGACMDNQGREWGTCSKCGTRQRIGDYAAFCPACGAPMLDKAVDILMKRLEELHEN